jgi:hypothetical protein
MLVFGLLTLSLVVVGSELLRKLWSRWDPEERNETSGLELAAAGALAGVSAWVAASWILALTHTLTAMPLWILTGTTILAAIGIVFRHARTLKQIQVSRETTLALIALTPLLLWLAFMLWRGLVVPVASHDALAYHMPKAVMLERAEGWEMFEAADIRIGKYPFNYELLLADMLILAQSDRYTEWLSAVFWIFILLTAAAMVRRWWGPGALSIGCTVLAVATAPILLLHSGAHKNDLMVGWFALCALFWGARWAQRGGSVPLLLTILALGMGLGTKTTIVAAGLGLAPFFLVRIIKEVRHRRLRASDLFSTLTAAGATLVLGGGFTYVVNLMRVPHVADMTRAAETGTAITNITWGDWSNLWQVPYLLLTVPFSKNLLGAWMPWHERYTFWPHYELYFSHYGRLFTISLLALPLVLWLLRRDEGRRVNAEWRVSFIAASLAIVIMLPTMFRPIGFFGTMSRYFLFIVPIVFAYVIPPLIAIAQTRAPRMLAVIPGLLVVVFSIEAVLAASRDRFVPLEYALWAAENPGTRFIYFYPFRSASMVDRVAAPDDTIAVDGSFDTWIYPAYGRDRTRPVVLLDESSTPDSIPAEVDWVIIDRSWNAVWSNPKFKDLSQMSEYFLTGEASEADIRLLAALIKDPRFKLMYHEPSMNQAVFRRVAP